MAARHIRTLALALIAALTLALFSAAGAHATTVGPVTVPDVPSTEDVGNLLPPKVKEKLPLAPPDEDPPPGGGSGNGGGGASGGSSSPAPTSSPNESSAPAASTPERHSGGATRRGGAEASAATPPRPPRGSTPGGKSETPTEARKSARAAAEEERRSDKRPRVEVELLAADELAGPGQNRKPERDVTLIDRLASPIPKEYRLPVFIIAGIALFMGLIALYQSRHRHRAEKHASSDPLTGLPNRKAFEERLASEWKRAERYNRPLGLLLMDVDDFKEINDTQGHAAGDRALRDLAAVIGGQMRESDMGARLSGDEFVALCPETRSDSLRSLAEALKISLGRHDLSVSIGYAEREAYDRGPSDLVDRADAAMYREKDRRRLAARDEPAAALSG